MIVTAVERHGRQKRVRVYLDGQLALTMGAGLAIERDVRVGRTVDHDELAALAEAEARRRALEVALRLLSYRAQTAKELRERLARTGFIRPVIDRTLERIQELGYLDDAAFARLWIETRQTARPRSRRLLEGELRRRGVGRETAEEATAGISDDEAAYEAATARLRPLRGLDYRRFRERLGGFLIRRGFSYDVARRAIERCWAELGEPEPDGAAS